MPRDVVAGGGALTLHRRILQELERRIVGGEWPPGHRIPSEEALAASYGCSRMTVNKALTQLAAAGLVERRRKAGSFVMRPQSRSAVLEIRDVRAEVVALGEPYRHEVVERKVERGRMSASGPWPGEVVARVYLVTVHYAAARVFCVEQRWIRLDTVPAAAEQAFEDLAPGAWLVRHVAWTTAEHRIRAEAVSTELARRMKIRRGTPLLVIERATWLAGRPVTFVRLAYPGDAHELVARFSPSVP
ncbi:MAG TPA: UTRA domain-containing protein [Burkholderiaceae bacterium]|nr:UTRA domain-containing protein [Burkholderiaceae bacterium]